MVSDGAATDSIDSIQMGKSFDYLYGTRSRLFLYLRSAARSLDLQTAGMGDDGLRREDGPGTAALPVARRGAGRTRVDGEGMQGGTGTLLGSDLSEGGIMDLAEIVQKALAAGTREKARELVAAEVGRICAADAKRDPAEVKKTLLSNIGYYTGYCDFETGDRICDLFETEHPIFGRRHPTAEEAFARGQLHGYLHSGRASQAGQEALQAFVAREDWPGLIEWMFQEAEKRDQLTVNS